MVIPAFMTFEGLWLFLVILTGLAVVLIVLAIIGMRLVLRRGSRRRWLGAGILIALLVYGFGPWLVMELRNSTRIDRMSQLTLWPDLPDLRGKTVLFVSVGGYVCGPACKQAALNSGAMVYAQDVLITYDRFGAVDRIHPGRGANYLIRPKAGKEIDLVQQSTLPIAELVVVQDNLGWFGQHDPALFDLPPEDAQQISRAMYLFEGDLPLEADRLIMRLPKSQIRELVPFLWAAGTESEVFGGDPFRYRADLAAWLCGTSKADVQEDCRYLF